MAAVVAVGHTCGSWVNTATALDNIRWVMGTYSICCGRYQVGHRLLQVLLWGVSGGSSLATGIAVGYTMWVIACYRY
jgi:hypothetical protein